MEANRANGKGDYAIKAGSPCLAIGFENFPMHSFGTGAAGISEAVRRARSQSEGGSGEVRFGLRYAGGVLLISHLGDYRARETDLTGALVAEREARSGADLRLEMRGRPPGMYLVFLRSRDHAEFRLFLLE